VSKGMRMIIMHYVKRCYEFGVHGRRAGSTTDRSDVLTTAEVCCVEN